MKRVTSWYVRIVSIVLIAALLFVVIGCSSGVESDISSPDYIDQIVNPDRSLFYGETITIATSWAVIINGYAVRYMKANPGVRINIIDYFNTLTRGEIAPSELSFDLVRPEIATQLMAGTAPTLIDGFLVDSFDPRQAVFFYDWYLLMDADPNFNEEDWFMNAFHGFSINGQLFQLPLVFFYHPLFVNTTIPNLSEAMNNKRDGVTMAELMELHREFSQYHSHLLEEYFTAERLLQYYIDRFVDIETGTVDFGEEFINLVTYAEIITCPDYHRRWATWPLSEASELRKSESYLFHFIASVWNHRFLDHDGERPFAGITPLVNHRGELLIESEFSYSYLLNANATPIEKAIAWDFIMFMMQHYDPNMSLALDGFMFRSINRDVFYNEKTRILPIMHREGHSWFQGTYEELIAGVHETMTRFHEMPMRYIGARPRVIDDIIEDVMNQFHDGLLSVEQAAELLQNQITLVLMEMER